jgi:hypothetical protein
MNTQSDFKEILDYNPETVEFTWKKALGTRAKAGDVAGHVHKAQGYHQIKIAGKQYKTHRLVWLFETGEWPKNHIDHMDGNRLNNHISNLRDVTQRENNQNLESHRNGRLVGCYFYKPLQKWKAQIKINRKAKHLGYFLTELQAHQAYLKALNEFQLQA